MKRKGLIMYDENNHEKAFFSFEKSERKRKAYLCCDNEKKKQLFIERDNGHYLITDKIEEADVCFVLDIPDEVIKDNIDKAKNLGIEIRDMNDLDEIRKAILLGRFAVCR